MGTKKLRRMPTRRVPGSVLEVDAGTGKNLADRPDGVDDEYDDDILPSAACRRVQFHSSDRSAVGCLTRRADLGDERSSESPRRLRVP